MRRRLLWILLIGLALALVVLIARHDAGTIAASLDCRPTISARSSINVALIVFLGGGVLVLFRESFSQGAGSGAVLGRGRARAGARLHLPRGAARRRPTGCWPSWCRAAPRSAASAPSRSCAAAPATSRWRRRSTARGCDGARHRRERGRADPGGRQGRGPAARSARPTTSTSTPRTAAPAPPPSRSTASRSAASSSARCRR